MTKPAAFTTPAADRPILLHMSPLPEMRNGIADYAAAILTGLARHYQCLCVVEDPQTVSDDIRRISHVLSYDDYARLAPDLAGARHLAHLGNNNDHVPILSAVGHVPLVAVVHDLTMHYLLECWARQCFGAAQPVAGILHGLHGAVAADLSARRYRDHVPVQALYTEADGLPLLNGWAGGAITHSHLGHVRLKAAGFGGDIRVIPHFATVPDPQQAAARRSRFRRTLGLKPDTTLLASLGFVTPNKQIEAVLQTLAALPPGIPDWHYIIAGENRIPSLPETCRDLGLEGRVTFIDYVTEAEFSGILDAADLCVNLRYPTSGETSGTVSRAMAHGLPSLVHAHGWYGELPTGAVYQVPPSDGPCPALRMQVLRALLDPEERQRKAAAAQDYARQHLTLDMVTDSYREVIETVWHRFAERGEPAARPPGRGVLSFPPPVALLPDGLSLDAALKALLAAEAARVDGVPLPVLHLTSGPLPDGARAPASPEDLPPAPVQGFMVIEDNTSLARLTLGLIDAVKRLRRDDLLTLALVSDPALTQVDPDAAHLPDDPGAWPIEERLRRCAAAAGLRVLRQGDRSVSLPEGPDPYRRILVFTMQLVGLLTGDAGFRPLPGSARA